MGFRAHVQKKHEIEYHPAARFNWQSDIIEDWLNKYKVCVCKFSRSDYDGTGEEWEIDKDGLRAIPDSAFVNIVLTDGEEVTAQDLRDFVRECIDAPTGDSAYVSWY